MPIYVYGCEQCGAVEEHIQRFSDPPMTECERCGGGLHKQITSAAFHLKGGGWYKDGYASSKSADGGGGAGASDAGASSTSDSSSSSAGESSSKSSTSSTSGSSGTTSAAAQ